MAHMRIWLLIVLAVLCGNSTWQVERAIRINRGALEANELLMDANGKLIEANRHLNEANRQLQLQLRRLFGVPSFEAPAEPPGGTLG